MQVVVNSADGVYIANEQAAIAAQSLGIFIRVDIGMRPRRFDPHSMSIDELDAAN